MLMGSCGFSGITLWEELLGKAFVYDLFECCARVSCFRSLLFSVLRFLFLIVLTLIVCRFLPYVGWVTIIMTEKPIIKVRLNKISGRLKLNGSSL